MTIKGKAWKKRVSTSEYSKGWERIFGKKESPCDTCECRVFKAIGCVCEYNIGEKNEGSTDNSITNSSCVVPDRVDGVDNTVQLYNSTGVPDCSEGLLSDGETD